MQGERLHWWQTRWFVVAAALAACVPLIWPDIPPIVDLPGHMGRYRVQLDRDLYPWFDDWFRFQWSLIGNLGVDLLIEPLAPLIGLEPAVKLIVMAIPLLTVVPEFARLVMALLPVLPAVLPFRALLSRATVLLLPLHLLRAFRKRLWLIDKSGLGLVQIWLIALER